MTVLYWNFTKDIYPERVVELLRKNFSPLKPEVFSFEMDGKECQILIHDDDEFLPKESAAFLLGLEEAIKHTIVYSFVD